VCRELSEDRLTYLPLAVVDVVENIDEDDKKHVAITSTAIDNLKTRREQTLNKLNSSTLQLNSYSVDATTSRA
jgi:hypothetical protein